MALQQVFSLQPVFTWAELQTRFDQKHSRNKRSREALVAYHLRRGHLLRVRRGLYAVVPPGMESGQCPVDPYLVAAKSAEDAVLGYHTALEVFGKAHSVFGRYFFLSRTSLRATRFREYQFECVRQPKALRELGKEHFATTMVDRMGTAIRVTTLERTMVDLFDRPDLGGGWEELWRSLESVEYFDLDLVVEYAKLLGNRTTAAKTGYFLQQHAQALMVEDRHLAPLRELRPKQPHYLERGKGGKLDRAWNLIVPSTLVERTWEEAP